MSLTVASLWLMDSIVLGRLTLFPLLAGSLAPIGLYADELVAFLIGLPIALVLGRYVLFGGMFLP
mgnify:FL=1